MSQSIGSLLLLLGLAFPASSQDWVRKTVFARNDRTPLRYTNSIVSEFSINAHPSKTTAYIKGYFAVSIWKRSLVVKPVEGERHRFVDRLAAGR